jgi:hypothetical protein
MLFVRKAASARAPISSMDKLLTAEFVFKE